MAAKYKEIVEDLVRNIQQGKYDETRKLPREEDLIDIYGVSRSTVRKAISVLVTQGYVYQVQGSGIFLRATSGEDYISLERLKGLTRDFPDRKIESRVIHLEIQEAGEEMGKRLGIKPEELVYYVKRVRVMDDEPFTVESSYYPKTVIPYLNEDILQSSFYSYVLNDLRLGIGFADKIIYADKLDQETAKLLQLKKGDPAFIIDAQVYLTNGTMFEFSRSIHNYQTAKFLVNVNF
ncbi:MAG: GntR family transcriptional regulator [Eubacteriaceae bacterium]